MPEIEENGSHLSGTPLDRHCWGHYALCVDDRGQKRHVTKGKEYYIKHYDRSDDTVLFVDDNGRKVFLYARRFVYAEGD